MFYLKNWFSSNKDVSLLPNYEVVNQSQNSYSSYDFSYHVKQFGKGAVLFGAGVFGYFWLNAVFGRYKKAQNDDLVTGIKDNLNFGSDLSLPQVEYNNFILDELFSFEDLVDYAVMQNDSNYNVGGAKFVVTNCTSGRLDIPKVKGLADNGFVITWQRNIAEEGGNSGSYNIHGQRFNPSAEKAGEEFELSREHNVNQRWHCINMVNTGGFMIGWNNWINWHNHSTVFAQRYNSSDSEVGNHFPVSSNQLIFNGYCDISKTINGKFAVTWQQDLGSDGCIYGRSFNQTGYPLQQPFRISKNMNKGQSVPQISLLNNNTFVVVWQRDDSALGQCHSTITGAFVGEEFTLSASSNWKQKSPTVSAFSNGGFVVAFDTNNLDSSICAVYAQLYNSECRPVAKAFQVNKVYFQGFPVVTTLANDDFVVIWTGVANVIYGRRYTYNAFPVGNTFQVSSLSSENQRSINEVNKKTPYVSSLRDGGFVVVWQDRKNNFYGIYARTSAPEIIGDPWRIQRGAIRHVNSDILQADCMSCEPNGIKFILRNVTHCYFSHINNTKISIDSFTQQDINDKKIFFTHDGTEYVPYSRIKAINNDGLATRYVDIPIEFSSDTVDWVNIIAIYSVVIGGCLLLTCGSAVLINCAAKICCKVRKKIKQKQAQESDDDLSVKPLLINESDNKSYQTFDGEVKLLDMIGNGSYGAVYRAEWKGATVAVKKLNFFCNIAKDIGLKSFKQEVAIMSNLHHPNIVQLFAYLEDPQNNDYLIVMELVSNGALSNYLWETPKKLTWPQRWQIAIDIAKGIAYLHDKKILHRDLKSPNVLLNEKMEAKLTDFGLARIRIATAYSSITTRLVGTHYWLAPELFSDPSYTEACDIYSYGMVLWELAAMEVPYKNISTNSPMQILLKVVNQGHREKIPDACPSSFADLIKRCWAQRSTDRPGTKEVITELEAKQDEANNIICNVKI